MRRIHVVVRLAIVVWLFLSMLSTNVFSAAQITELYLPKYVIKGTDQQRLQSAAYLQITGLTPNATYRYFTGASNNANLGTTLSPGGYFGLTPDATPGDGLVDGYASSKAMGNLAGLLDDNAATTSGSYSMLSTNSQGSYTGWFSVVPDGFSPFSAGNSLYFYIQLNTPGGITVTQSIHTTNTMTVLASATSGTNSATALAGYGGATVGNERMVLLYDDVAGAGRPIWGTWTEQDGIATSFSTWYNINVAGFSGGWAAYVPNNLPNGIRRVEYRDENANLLYAITSVDGTWTKSDLSGTLSTVNPAGGNSPLFIAASPLGRTTLQWSNAASTGLWNTSDLNWSAGANTVVFSSAVHDPVAFADGPMVGNVAIVGSVSPSSVTVSNQSGVYHFAGGGIGGSANFAKSGSGTVELASANSYSGGTTVAGGKLVEEAQDALPNSRPLTISSGRVEIASRAASDGNKKTLVLSSLALSGDGILDVNDNDLLIQTASNAQVCQWLMNGQSNASLPKIISTWAGTHSGEGLGYMSAADYATFHPGADLNGQPITPNAVLVCYTLLGDATLDGRITLDDYAQIEAGFFFGHFDGTTRIATWDHGDFNYDGKVDYRDYAIIDAGFSAGNSLAADNLIARHAAQFGPSYLGAVQAYAAQAPEPASLLLIASVVPLLARRRQ